MGLITGLLLSPVMAPVWGFRFVLERLQEEAEANLRDEGRGFAELIDLSMRHSAGKLSDAEYAEQEAALLDRLSAIRESREELLNARFADYEDDADEDDVLDDEREVEDDAMRDVVSQSAEAKC
jgi:hypothetical protein